jgi:hypothetical protein
MENLTSLTISEILYFIFLIIFTFYFGYKGILQSLGFTIKIFGSIALPFVTYKKIINFLSNYFSNNEFLTQLLTNYSLISEIGIFILVFLFSYFIFGIFEKILKINFVKNSTIRIIDFFLGCFYGLFLFSILFYFIFNLILKNHLNENNIHKIMIYNADLYDTLKTYKDDSSNSLDEIKIEDNDEIY